jgi:antitoxin (DNA-binding transcriptional repressor) of toxin-antitoxin stability system
MKIAPLTDVAEQFRSYIDDSKKSPVIVTDNGKPVAMIVAIEEDDDLDRLLLAHNPRFLQLLEESRQHVRVTGGLSLTEFRQKLAARYASPAEEVVKIEA